MTDAEVYEAAVKKGKALLAAMKAPPHVPVEFSQPSPRNSYEALQNHGWNRDTFQEAGVYTEEVTPELLEVMQQYNVSVGDTNNIAIYWEHNNTTGLTTASVPTLFDATLVTQKQLYNVASGTIVAIEINSPAQCVRDNKGHFDNALLPSDQPVLQHWSDLTFLQWQELANDPEELKGLKQVIHRKVSNRYTKVIIRTVLKETGKTRTREMAPRLERFTEEDGDDFLALLGSPNGFGTVFLLAQHKEQLGWKCVKRISVHQAELKILVLEFENLP